MNKKSNEEARIALQGELGDEFPYDIISTAMAWTAGWQENGNYSDSHMMAIRTTLARSMFLERKRSAEAAKAYLQYIEGCSMRDDEPDLLVAAIMRGES